LDKLTAFGRARRHRPLFLIDLAMPRDIDPAVQKLDGIYLYDLDSLRSIAGRTLAVRKQESQRCHQLIERHVHEFQSWMERTQALNLLSSGEYSQMAFDYARSNPDGYGAVFSKAMSGFSAIQSAWALEALRDYDFSSISTWCDVGGGHGHMMCWGSGQERTEEEYASLLNASGWRLVTCHYPPHASMGVIEGIAT
jgi:Shikimate / quinate 5-dehydrogenase